MYTFIYACLSIDLYSYSIYTHTYICRVWKRASGSAYLL